MLDSAHPQIGLKIIGTSVSFQFRNEEFFARLRKSRDGAEAYMGTSHKRSRRLTPRLRKRAISGWKLDNNNTFSYHLRSRMPPLNNGYHKKHKKKTDVPLKTRTGSGDFSGSCVNLVKHLKGALSL
jgi:hypothetical protein